MDNPHPNKMETAKPTPMENRVMKEIPILMSTPMVQAILDERKTMTRRVKGFHKDIIENPDRFKYIDNSIENPDMPRPAVKYDAAVYYRFQLTNSNATDWVMKCPYGKPGDRLWVREGFRDMEPHVPRFQYRSDYGNSIKSIGWKPSIHMPKSACRIWLEVVSVRVERLQEITEQDAVAEGIEGRPHSEDPSLWLWKDYSFKDRFAHGSNWNSITSFKSLWQSINGPDSWNANPFVWVVEFKRITKN